MGVTCLGLHPSEGQREGASPWLYLCGVAAGGAPEFPPPLLALAPNLCRNRQQIPPQRRARWGAGQTLSSRDGRLHAPRCCQLAGPLSGSLSGCILDPVFRSKVSPPLEAFPNSCYCQGVSE